MLIGAFSQPGAGGWMRALETRRDNLPLGSAAVFLPPMVAPTRTDAPHGLHGRVLASISKFTQRCAEPAKRIEMH